MAVPVVAMSAGESEALKMHDPFKQDVKLSKLKIYVAFVHEGLNSTFCSLHSNG